MEHRMCREDRAKQFMPFAALKGHTEALRKKEKIIVPRAELSEEYREMLDQKMLDIHKNDIVTVVYFNKGEYLKMTGKLSKIDIVFRVLKVVNTKIKFENIYDINKG